MAKPNEFMDKFLPASYWGKVHYPFINIIPLLISLAIFRIVSIGLFSLFRLHRELVFLISFIVFFWSFFKIAGVQSVITEKIVDRYGIYEQTRKNVRRIYIIGVYITISLGVLYFITIPR